MWFLECGYFTIAKCLVYYSISGNSAWNLCKYVLMPPCFAHTMLNTSRSFPHSWHINGFVTRLTWRMSLLEQELPTLPEQLSSPPVFSRVLKLYVCVCFVDRCLSLYPFFVWSLRCLSFFDLQILITHLVSSNSSEDKSYPGLGILIELDLCCNFLILVVY